MKRFERNTEFETLLDSMCYDSGTVIYSDKTDNTEVNIIVHGEVDVDYNGERFHHFSDMPKDLQTMFLRGDVYRCPDVSINSNNWYEIVVEVDGQEVSAEVAECIEGLNIDEIAEYCNEFIEQCTKSNPDNSKNDYEDDYDDI